MTLTAATAEVGVRAGYPQITVPMGYDATIRRPLALSFTSTAGDDAKLLGFAYAYEREAQIRRPPSEINPQTWHCVAIVRYLPRTCGPGELSPAEPPPVQVSSPVGGTVPATLSLTLGPPATFGAFRPGAADTYTATTTANVISTALDARLDVEDPGRLMNGSFALAQPVQVEIAPNRWTAPVSNAAVTLTFRQSIGADEPLRTGVYAKTLTFTLSTTNP
jgi:amidase